MGTAAYSCACCINRIGNTCALLQNEKEVISQETQLSGIKKFTVLCHFLGASIIYHIVSFENASV